MQIPINYYYYYYYNYLWVELYGGGEVEREDEMTPLQPAAGDHNTAGLGYQAAQHFRMACTENKSTHTAREIINRK